MANLYWIPNFYEGDQSHNWLNLAFWVGPDTPVSFQTSAYFKLEDQVGQRAKNYINASAHGYLGSSAAVDPISDPTWSPNGYVILASSQYVTLNAFSWMANSVQIGLSLWFRTNAVITGDADTTDAQQDMVLFRRQYKGSTDAIVVMLTTDPGNANQYLLKLKLYGTVYTYSNNVLVQNAW
jgi:hypothetical protein